MRTVHGRITRSPKRVLALPDVDQAKAAVLNSLTSASGRRTYDHAIRECVGRLAHDLPGERHVRIAIVDETTRSIAVRFASPAPD